MKRGIIYLILNKQNGYKYIANTTLTMNKEWIYHIDKSKRMSSEPLHKAFREYGIHNFMIKELEECYVNEFENKTNYWIEKYQPEYNPIKETIEPVEIEEVKKEKKPREYRAVPHLIKWNEENRGNGKHFGFKIRGKNLETGLCTDYESARVAAEQVTGKSINNSNIILAARTGRTAYGHKWQIIEEKDHKSAVFGVNKKTEQIELLYESINAALRAHESNDKQGILKSLKNPGRFSWKGCWWFYSR